VSATTESLAGLAQAPTPKHASDWPTAIRLGLRLLLREWRGGELRVLTLALLVAVAGITAVGFFVDRMESAMVGRASQLLAADLLVTSRQAIPREMEEQARQMGLDTARTLTTRSVVLAGEFMRLTEVKAVTQGYPLRGTMREADTPFGDDRVATGIPAAGEAWLEARLLAALDLKVGDSINLGAKALKIARVITVEPDRGGDIFSIAPRVMMNMTDLNATELVQPGSRVRHRLLFAGQPAAIAALQANLAESLAPGFEIQDLRNARPELRRALDMAGQFLGLAALVGIMLAGAAIAVSASRHAERHLDTAALMRCMGASQRFVMNIYAVQLLILALAAGIAGSSIGYAAQYGLAALVGSLWLGDLPPAGMAPFGAGLAVAFVTLGGFGLPPLLRLREVPPSRVLRRDIGTVSVPAWLLYGAGFMALGAIAWWQAGHWKLAAIVLGGSLGALAVLALGAYALVRGLGLLRGRLGPAGRFAVAGLTRRTRASVAQVVAFGLGMLALMLLALLRGELLDEWRSALPEDAPNYFLINIQPDEVDSLKQYMLSESIDVGDFNAFIRGRILTHNGKAIDPDSYGEPRAQRLSGREHNLSFAAVRPQHNELVSGQWWSEDGDNRPQQFSVEEGIAQALGLSLGDRLRFTIAGVEVEGEITSLRRVDWESFKVNFFFIGHPELLKNQPATYATSFHLSPDRRSALIEIVRRHPSVTVMDVDALMTQVRGIMDHASLGIEYVFGFTLLAGLMVLLATIQSTLDERRRESAILRTLGARRPLLVNALLIEFALLGAVAGALSAGAANLIALVIAEQIFGFTLSLQPGMWLAAVLLGALGVATAGYLGTRSVLNQPPLLTLRDG
jgi:putative ABC transport system permease protein